MKNSFSDNEKNLDPSGSSLSNTDIDRKLILAELSKLDRMLKKCPPSYHLARYLFIETKLLLISELEQLVSPS